MIHDFQYNGRFFKAGELTVGLYMSWLLEPEDTIKNILLEFNSTVPELNSKHLDNFLNIIFNIKEDTKKKKKEDFDPIEEYEDLEYFVTLLATQIKQPISEVLKLPITSYHRLLKRLEEIIDPAKYEKRTNKPDKKGLKEIKQIIK